MSNAKEHLEKAIQINPEYDDAHYELALILSENNEFEKSKVHFLKTIEIREDFALSHFHYALLLNKMKDHKASKEHFLKAIDLDQHFADAPILHSPCDLQPGRTDPARKRISPLPERPASRQGRQSHSFQRQGI